MTKLPLVLRCMWFHVCRFRDYDQSGTNFTLEIMRHSSSINNQFKSWTSGERIIRIITFNFALDRLSPFFFFLLLCHEDTSLQSGPAPPKWANERLLIIYSSRRIFFPSPSRLCTNELRITYFPLADSRETIGSASWVKLAAYAASENQWGALQRHAVVSSAFSPASPSVSYP